MINCVVYSLGNWNGVYGQSLKKYLLLGSMEVSFSTAQNLSSLKVYFYFVFVYTHTPGVVSFVAFIASYSDAFKEINAIHWNE